MGEESGATSDVPQVLTVDCVECLQENLSDDNVTAMVTETKDKSRVAGVVDKIEVKSGHYEELNVIEQSSDGVRDRELSGESNNEKSESGNLPVKNNNRLSIVWWKMPLEIVKYCVFKVKPVWSFSAAVALIGFVMFGRTLYRLKHRTLILPLRLGIDDKKASQSVVTRAARLSEAFSTMSKVLEQLPLSQNVPPNLVHKRQHLEMVALVTKTFSCSGTRLAATTFFFHWEKLEKERERMRWHWEQVANRIFR